MPSHVDILDQSESLGRPFAGSIVFHIGLTALVVGGTWLQNQKGPSLGDPNGGRLGSVLIKPVSGIDLPHRGGPTNPLASDTKSQLPPPPPTKAPPKTKAKAPDPTAVVIPSKNAKRKTSLRDIPPPDKWNAKQQYAPNQLTSRAGQALSDPTMGVVGNGVGLSGNSSPFGTQFGAYADIIRDRVAGAWKTGDIDGRIRTAPKVIVNFTLFRDGHVSNVRVTQPSGIPALDYSAQRAILEAAPFPQLPAGFPRNETTIDFVFELKR